MRRSIAGAIGIVILLTASASACGGSEPEVVELGGARATSKTVERPWGTVQTFPELTTAQPPIAADTTFATDMTAHHAQAVELSENLLTHDDVDKRITAAAGFIKQDQMNEIATMNAWLDAWDDTSTGASHDGHHDRMGAMPGMLPPSDVDAVQSMSAGQAQVEFLRLMTIHHQGAITMSQEYLAQGKNTFTRSIAQHIIREQQLEIDYFTYTIDELCAAGTTPSCPRS